MADKATFANPDDLIRRYEAGTSVAQLSREIGISRATVTKFLAGAGVKMRSRSDAERVKWRGIKNGGRVAVERQMSAAWTARRGSKDTPETLSKRAAARCRVVGTDEDALAVELRQRG